jgi:hypothetical protein
VLGKLGFDEEIIMQNFNYRRVQSFVKLAIAFVKLGQEILKLLNMAFNYYINKKNRTLCPPVQDGYQNLKLNHIPGCLCLIEKQFNTDCLLNLQ